MSTKGIILLHVAGLTGLGASLVFLIWIVLEPAAQSLTAFLQLPN
jgi:hypothetical protein